MKNVFNTVKSAYKELASVIRNLFSFPNLDQGTSSLNVYIKNIQL